MTENNKTISIIDKLIFGLVILFLLSLTNSIFVNQLGYYGALLLILIRFALTKENQFKKTGLELFFGIFLLAEFLSAVFSADHAHAFQNFTRRLLLIPTLYTIVVASEDIKKAKLFFKVFLGASLISIVIYLINSYQYYIYNLYQIHESGPSLFQYPITASEIMSFTVIFLFAFLINEKQSVKYKLLIALLFIVAVLALLSTYKRTGWIGTAAGIFAILILKKNWKIIIPVMLLGIVLFFSGKNKSEIYLYKINGESLNQTAKIETKGRAYDLYSDKGFTYVSDFENGILKLKGKEIQSSAKMPGPVLHLDKWKNKLFASLVDTRFVLLDQDSLGNLQPEEEILSPGFTVSYQAANNFLYIMDKDSGLTIFTNPDDIHKKIRISEIKVDGPIYVDSVKLFFYNEELTELVKYDIKNGLPSGNPRQIKLKDAPSYLFYSDNKLLSSTKNGLILFKFIDNDPEELSRNSEIKNIFSITKSENKILIADLNKNIFLLDYPFGNSLKVTGKGSLGFVAKSVSFENGTLFASNVRRNRLQSIVDPYHPNNFNRFALWRAGWLMFKDHPVFGVGDIDLNNLYRQYKRATDKELQGHLHNNYVHFLAILGGFGIIAVMLLLVRIMLIQLRIYRSVRKEPFVSSYALGTVGGFVAFLIAGLTEWNFGDHEVITMVWFILGLNFAFYFLSSGQAKSKPEILNNVNENVY
ncbi:MAG: O-antigen ligase family protein [Bacillota bacterium]